MTLKEIYDLRYGSNDLKDRVTTAVAASAFAILGESGETPNHAARLVWAKATLLNAIGEGERFMWAMMANPTVLQLGTEVDDGSLAYIVGQLVNTFAV